LDSGQIGGFYPFAMLFGLGSVPCNVLAVHYKVHVLVYGEAFQVSIPIHFHPVSEESGDVLNGQNGDVFFQ